MVDRELRRPHILLLVSFHKRQGWMVRLLAGIRGSRRYCALIVFEEIPGGSVLP